MSRFSSLKWERTEWHPTLRGIVFFGKLALYRLVQDWLISPENTSSTRSASACAT